METIYSIVKESKTVYVTDFTCERLKIMSSATAADIVRRLIGDGIEVQEYFYIMVINRANEVLAVHRLSTGSQSGTVIDVRVILKTAIDLLGHAVILFHNHPSGNMKPSREDLNMTIKIKNALEMVDMKLLDHILISPESGVHYSMSDNGDI